MRRLNSKEIEEFQKFISLPLSDAEEIAEIIYKTNKSREANKSVNKKDILNNVDSYVNHWNCEWSKYNTWDDVLYSEAELGCFGHTIDSCERAMGKAIFKLSSDLFIKLRSFYW